MPIKPTDAREIQAAIVRRGQRQRDVAHAAGLTPDRLSAILTGSREPRPGELQRVADAIRSLGGGR
jgi:transcriptional regulator with XRE-family HTH domain